jgi:hypothetical protein
VANLLDVVASTNAKQVPVVPEVIEARWVKATTEQDHVRWLQSRMPAVRGYGGPTKKEKTQLAWANEVIADSDKAVEDLLWGTFLESDQLPVPMADRAPKILNNLRTTPRAPLADLMEVTRRLGFIVVPWEYLSPASYTSEPQGMQEAITTFGALDGRLDVYVICPPTYYSLENHINAANPNRQIYAGKNEQAFMALKLTLPTLRSMQLQINVLKQNQATLGRDMRDAVAQLAQGQKDLATQVEQLKMDVNAQLKQMQDTLAAELRSSTQAAVLEAGRIVSMNRASKKDKAKAQAVLDSLGNMNLKDVNEALAKLEQITWDLLEPLMFALKPGTQLRAPNADAILGPCWGPDFADIIATAAELKVDKAKRKEAETSLEVWGNIYSKKSARQKAEQRALDEYIRPGSRGSYYDSNNRF